jgi:hypothetical protein
MSVNVMPTVIVVDIREVLKVYSSYGGLYNVYRYFPLQEIVQCVLTVNAYGDDGEYFWLELDRRFESHNCTDSVDYNTLSIFHENLCNYLDEHIRQKVPSHVETCEYVFDRWVGNTAIALQRDRNVSSCNRLM